MTDGSRTPDPPSVQRRAWSRLGRALRPRANRSQVIVGALCVALGLSIAVQVRHHDEDALSTASQQELVRLLDESTRHVTELETENADLDRTLEMLRLSRTDDVAAQDAARERLNELEILAGTAPAHGRGVRIRITQAGGGLRASTVLSVLQELRNAGAEVIQVGEVRVVTSSAVTTSSSGEVQVDGNPLGRTFTILAIGAPDVIEPALRIPGGAADTLTADGATVEIAAQDEVRIDAVVRPRVLRHAEVVK